MRSEHAKYRDTQTREWTPDGPLTLSGTTILKRAEALVLLEVKDAKCLFIKIEFDNFSAGQGMVPQVGVVPFSSCPQSLPASESFPRSQLFA